jgi:hypothetical protein
MCWRHKPPRSRVHARSPRGRRRTRRDRQFPIRARGPWRNLRAAGGPPRAGRAGNARAPRHQDARARRQIRRFRDRIRQFMITQGWHETGFTLDVSRLVPDAFSHFPDVFSRSREGGGVLDLESIGIANSLRILFTSGALRSVHRRTQGPKPHTHTLRQRAAHASTARRATRRGNSSHRCRVHTLITVCRKLIRCTMYRIR